MSPEKSVQGEVALKSINLPRFVSSFDRLTGPTHAAESDLVTLDLTQTLRPGLDKFFERCGIPENERHRFSVLLRGFSQAELFLGIALARCEGCRWEQVPQWVLRSYSPENFALDQELQGFWTSYDDPMMRYHSQLRPKKAAESDKLFAADFIPLLRFQVDRYKHSGGGRSVDQVRHFAMLVPDANQIDPSVRRHTGQNILLIPSGPGDAPEVFAHLQFQYKAEESAYVVTNIDIPSLGVSFLEGAASYDATEVVVTLISAFEDYIRTVHPSCLGSPSIVLPFPDTFLQFDSGRISDGDFPSLALEELRIRTKEGVISRALRLLAPDPEIGVVSSHGYCFQGGLEIFLGQDKLHQPSSVDFALVKSLEYTEASSLQAQLTRSTSNRFDTWRELGEALGEHLREDHRARMHDREGRAIESQRVFSKRIDTQLKADSRLQLQGLIPVQASLIDFTCFEGLPNNQIGPLERALEAWVVLQHSFLDPGLTHRLPADLTFLARGKKLTDFKWTDLAKRGAPGERWLALQTPGMDRHPQIIHAHFGDDGQLEKCSAIGLKAGGLRYDANSQDIEIPNDGAELPIYFRPGPEGQLLQPWGSGNAHSAMSEFMQLCSLHWGSFKAFGEPAAAPFPARCYRLERIPYWTEHGEERWLEETDYRAKYLHDFPDPLGTLTLQHGSPIRITTLYENLFGHPSELYADAQKLKREVDIQLELLYCFLGTRLRVPDSSQALDQSDLTWRDVHAYCREVYLHNKSHIEAAVERIEQRTLQTIGLVHGAGGHFGGDPSEQFDVTTGAKGGGACEKRNFEVTGRLNDFEAGAVIPWASSLPTRPEYLSNEELLELLHHQQADLHDWQTSIYLLRAVLCGDALSEDETMLGNPFGKPGTILTEGDNLGGRLVQPAWYIASSDQRPVKKLRGKDLLERCLQPITFINARHQNCYEDAHARGRTIMRELTGNQNLSLGIETINNLTTGAIYRSLHHNNLSGIESGKGLSARDLDEIARLESADF